MGDAGIRNAADRIDLRNRVIPVVGRHAFTVAVAGRLGVDAFVAAGRISVVNPEECADFRRVARRVLLDDAPFGDFDDLAGTELMFQMVIEVRQRGRFHGDRVCAGLFADHDRRASEAVPGGVNAPFDQDQDRTRPVDHVLRIPDAFNQRLLPVDQHGDDLGRIQLSVVRLRKMADAGPEGGVGDLVDIVDLPHGHDREIAEFARNDERLVFVIADDADPGAADELIDVVIEFRAELRIRDVVNSAGDAPFAVAHGKPAAFGSQVRVVVRSVEKVAHTVMVRDDAEKSAHG